MLREKTANSPLLLIRRAPQLFALAASRKGCKAAFRKSQHAHKGKRFFSSLPGLTRCPFPTIESVKGSCTRLCEKSDKKQGRNAQLPPSFLFFSPLFQRTTPPSTGFSRRRHQIPMTTAQTRSQEKLHPFDIPTQNKRRHSLPMPVLRTADRPTCVYLPPSLRFLRAQKNSYPSSDG